MEFVYSFPGVKGIQANKEYYITMIPLKYLAKILPETDRVFATRI